MHLLRNFRGWIRGRSRKRDTEQRRVEPFAHATVEQLEQRLCLGGLTAPPVETPSLPPVPAAAATPHQPAARTATPHAGASVLELPTPEPPPASSQAPSGGTTAPLPRGSTRLGPQLSTDIADGPSRSSHDRTSGIDRAPDPTEVRGVGGSPATAVSTAILQGGGANRAAAASGTTAAAALDETDALEATTEHFGAGALPWWMVADEATVVRYDFRDADGAENEITDVQRELAMASFDAWTDATEGKVVFVQDTAAELEDIVNVGVGDLAAGGRESGPGNVLGLGGGHLELNDDGTVHVRGAVWLDHEEQWDTEIGNGNPEGTTDFFTVAAHETGHVLGYDDSSSGREDDVMNGVYSVERTAAAVLPAALGGSFYTSPQSGAVLSDYELRPMVAGAQLAAAEVEQLLERGTAATSSNDAIIAVVDRGGRILGVRVEDGVLADIPDMDTLIYAIDGAVAKARTAAFFSNGDPDNATLAPLTSRLVQFVSQSTVTQREVQSNPNAGLTVGGGLRTAADYLDSTTGGPGLVAPIGLGGHFPPGVEHTPPVDLFAIEQTNRDSFFAPGPDRVVGTADDVPLVDRFNADGLTTVHGLEPPVSYGVESGLLPRAQARGVATLPGGIPLFRDTTGDGVGETLVGGIGVFFPGETGYADFEQNFQPGVGQTAQDRLNAPKVLESEYIAFAAAGGSLLAESQFGVAGAKIEELGGVAAVPGLDMPFGRLDLVGITLPVVGPIAGRTGVERLLAFGENLGEGTVNGADQVLSGGVFSRDGEEVAEGWLVAPKDGNGITAAEVSNIIERGREGAASTRAAVRLPVSSPTRMVFAVTDLDGEVVGLFRMKDATIFSVDVAVAKARNAAYYANPDELDAFDQVDGVPAGTAFTARTFRFLAEPRFPSGVDGSTPPAFSILNQPSIDRTTAENVGAPAEAGDFLGATANATVLGHNSFFPGTNFQDPDDFDNQNGVVFFPGSAPLYRGDELIGGLGVSGDGVDQDDVVSFLASTNFLPSSAVPRADQVFVRDVRLPYFKFLRNPTGSVSPFD